MVWKVSTAAKLLWQDWPEVLVGLGYFSIGMSFLVYKWQHDKRNHTYIPRYKYCYTVMRPDDERLELYPKGYITDNYLLPKDHPVDIRDCKRTVLGPVKDPYIRK